MTTEANLKLYYDSFSICSNMVRMMIHFEKLPCEEALVVIRAKPLPQLQEWFLKLNPNGYVPVLVDQGKPISDSLDIAYHLERYIPGQFPKEHRTEIDPLLKELHQISYYSLTYGEKDSSKSGFAKDATDRVEYINELIQKPDTSDEYRKLLEYKLEHFKEEKLASSSYGSMQDNRVKTDHYLQKIRKLVDANGGPFVFGSHPSVIDAHTACLLQRLTAKGHSDLIKKNGLDNYFMALQGTEAFKSVSPK